MFIKGIKVKKKKCIFLLHHFILKYMPLKRLNNLKSKTTNCKMKYL